MHACTVALGAALALADILHCVYRHPELRVLRFGPHARALDPAAPPPDLLLLALAAPNSRSPSRAPLSAGYLPAGGWGGAARGAGVEAGAVSV